MARYCIVSASPKGATNHLNSRFKLLAEDGKPDHWSHIGWKSTAELSDILRAGHTVLTGEITEEGLDLGDAVELEVRIVHNGTKYKIGGMPDK